MEFISVFVLEPANRLILTKSSVSALAQAYKDIGDDPQAIKK